MNSENEKSLRTFINDIYDSVRLPSDAIMKQPSPETIIELFIDLVVTNPSNKNDIILKLYILFYLHHNLIYIIIIKFKPYIYYYITTIIYLLLYLSIYITTYI